MRVLAKVYKEIKSKGDKNLEIILKNFKGARELSIVVFGKSPEKIEKVDFRECKDKTEVYYSTFYVSNAVSTFSELECPPSLVHYLAREPVKSFKKKAEEDSKVSKTGYVTAAFFKGEIKPDEVKEMVLFFIERFKEKIKKEKNQ